MDKSKIVTTDAWQMLRAATPARIALSRSGGSLPTAAWLEFKSAHASARQAVHESFDAEHLASEIAALGAKVEIVDSAAGDRLTFLQRPDLGRRLAPKSEGQLIASASAVTSTDLTIIVSDGLSALAVHRQAPSLLAYLLPRLLADGWTLAPIVIARFGRVALQDQIGQLLGSQLAVILLGERPGLGSPDSMGAYVVYAPQLGNTDANRNCVSSIRPEGLMPQAAADTIYFLLTEARRRRLSGVQLKDERLAIPPKCPVLPEKSPPAANSS
jgi:ethanolamine ammonia-lyase small subunit